MSTKPTLTIFVDGSNLYACQRSLRMMTDFQKLLDYFSASFDLRRAFYFTAMKPLEEHNPLKKIVDWLSYNGWQVITKPVKTFRNEEGEIKIKGNMDIELAVEMMKAAKYSDTIILFSGDGDFTSLIKMLQDDGKRIIVCSSIKTQPSYCADELRRQADIFIDLADIADKISKKHTTETIETSLTEDTTNV